MFTLKIKTDNDAFFCNGAGHEVARLLRVIADRVEQELDDSGRVRDANGNHVGDWELT